MPSYSVFTLKKTIHLISLVAGLLTLLFVCSECVAQVPATESTASVSGRVTIGGKGADGVTVVATITESPLENRTVAKTITDPEGNYQLKGLSAGNFMIRPLAKSFVAAGKGGISQPGQMVKVSQNAAISKIDFALVRGGVITGRITDLEGRPIIGEKVNVVTGKESESASAMPPFDQGRNHTDDRGVYRIYGLRPGNYTVSVGRDAPTGNRVNFFGGSGSQYTKTFYPGVTDASKATVIEISDGTEVTNIDIATGRFARGFSVTGRVIDAETNKPVANAIIAYSTVNKENQTLSGMNVTGNQSDENGKFRLEGIEPGQYAAFISSFGLDNSYSEPTPFYVTSGDVSGIEIKVRRGAIMEGVAVIENNVDPSSASLLESVALFVYVTDPQNASPPSYSQSRINRDGSFRFAGLTSGKARIHMTGFPTAPRGLEIVRTEVQGQDAQSGIEVTAGGRVTGVRVIFSYGTGKIRGELKTQSGVWPDGLSVSLSLRAVGGTSHQSTRAINVDPLGQFTAENIPPGTYLLRLGSNEEVPRFEPVERTINVANGVEVPITIVIDLRDK